MQTPIYRIIKIRKFWRKAGHSWLCETRESIIYMRLEIFGTYDFLFVSDGINRKNKKKWWAAGSFNICHLVYPSMPYRQRRFVPYMMHSFINPYVIAIVSFGVTRQYYGFVWYLPAESYRLYSEWTNIIETYADDLYFFLLGLYLYAFKTSRRWRFVPNLCYCYCTGGSSALLDDVMDSYATCLWNLIVFMLGGLILLGAMPIWYNQEYRRFNGFSQF